MEAGGAMQNALREEASKDLGLMPSFIFIVTFYVFIFKSNHPITLIPEDNLTLRAALFSLSFH